MWLLAYRVLAWGQLKNIETQHLHSITSLVWDGKLVVSELGFGLQSLTKYPAL